MPKFAVYFVPDSNTDFYRLGSAILGYDIRARETCSLSSELQSELGEFDPSWTRDARPYGFHLTIGDAIEFNIGDLHQIEVELSELLRCFGPDERFELRKHSPDFIPNWGLPIVLRYDPNDYLRTFHALVVSRINTLGIGSGYLKRYLQSPDQYANEPQKASRILKFYSPFVLGDFNPHFSLLNPYEGSNRSQLVAALTRVFDRFEEFKIDSICLMVQLSDEDDWSIYKELKR